MSYAWTYQNWMAYQVNCGIYWQHFVYHNVMRHVCYIYFNILNYDVVAVYENILIYQMSIWVVYILRPFWTFHLYVVYSTIQHITCSYVSWKMQKFLL